MPSRGETTNPEVDDYISRSEKWPTEMTELRDIMLGCGLTEEIKWAKPCYSYRDKNIAIMQEMKHFLALMFFKGVLLKDPAGALEEQGPNTRSARRICFRSPADVAELTETVEALVAEAIEVEKAGLIVDPAPDPGFVVELQERLDNDREFRAAFEGLTPGRQREYNLHFSTAKQATTRQARLDKYAPKILEGKGFRDR